MKYFSGDRYEYILVGIIFGAIGFSILLMLITLPLPHHLLIAKNPPQFWIIAGKILGIIWFFISVVFWFSIILSGRKIMKSKEYQNALLKNTPDTSKKLTKEEEKKKYGL